MFWADGLALTTITLVFKTFTFKEKLADALFAAIMMCLALKLS